MERLDRLHRHTAFCRGLYVIPLPRYNWSLDAGLFWLLVVILLEVSVHVRAEHSKGTTVGKFSIFHLLRGRFMLLPSLCSRPHHALLMSWKLLVCMQGRQKQFRFGTAKWDTSTAELGQCVEARSADLYIARSAEIFLRGHFSVAWMGSCSTFVLCTALPLLSGFRAIRDCLTLDVERKCTLPW